MDDHDDSDKHNNQTVHGRWTRKMEQSNSAWEMDEEDGGRDEQR